VHAGARMERNGRSRTGLMAFSEGPSAPFEPTGALRPRRRFLLRGLLKVPSKTCSVAALQEALLLMPAGPERYWKRIETAPVGVAVRLIIANRSGGHHGHFPLPHLCRLTATGWINAATGDPLAVRPLAGSFMWKRCRTGERGNVGQPRVRLVAEGIGRAVHSRNKPT